jgi:hypothetical protein
MAARISTKHLARAGGDFVPMLMRQPPRKQLGGALDSGQTMWSVEVSARTMRARRGGFDAA